MVVIVAISALAGVRCVVVQRGEGQMERPVVSSHRSSAAQRQLIMASPSLRLITCSLVVLASPQPARHPTASSTAPDARTHTSNTLVPRGIGKESCDPNTTAV
jgi:hypothetical protein